MRSQRGSRNVRALLALNAVLLGVLGVVTFAPSAGAQARVRGDYVMVAGTVIGSRASVVYIVDTANQELMALTYDHSRKRLQGVGYRNLAADATDLTRVRTRAGG